MKTLRTELIHYFNELDTELHFAFMEVRRETRKGTIHALRVAIKRLRAFIQMLAEIDPHFNGKAAVKQLKPFFRQAGRLRDLQIESSLLYSDEKKLDLEHQVSQQLKERILEQQLAFAEFEKVYSLACIRELCMQARSRLTHIKTLTLQRGLRKYLKNLFNDLTQLSREGLTSRKQLHELRKRVKEAYYNIIALDAATPHLSLSMELLKPLEALQHQLGLWQDHRITMEEAKNLWDVPQSLKRQLREDEERCLQDIRISLAQLPPLLDQLLAELDTLLKPRSKTLKADQLTH